MENKSNAALENKNEQNTPQALSDESRVKVMSPSMLVFKRFIRNRLAVVGFVILAFMFVFSFVGPIFSSYKEDQQFYRDELVFKTFAEFKIANEYNFYNATGATIDSTTQTMATGKLAGITDFGKIDMFSFDGTAYFAKKLGNGTYEIFSVAEVAKYTRSAADNTLTRVSETIMPDDLFAMMSSQLSVSSTCKFTYVPSSSDSAMSTPVEYIAYEEAIAGNTDPSIKSNVILGTPVSQCIATTLVMHDVADGNKASIADADAIGIIKNYYPTTTPVATGAYTCGTVSNGEMVVKKGTEDFVVVTDYVLNSKASEFIPFEIKTLVAAEAKNVIAKSEDKGAVDYTDANGKKATYEIDRVTDNYTSTTPAYQIKKETTQRKLIISGAPSSKNILGTDTNGMDVITRLMYGGRISLMVGFVVVGIEILIGVVLGGIAGYFSGWVDVIVMRFIELFNCIPFYPMMLIIGSVLDAKGVSPSARILLLMVLLGLLGWPGIARIVRGQILSLREQDFIVATEACGIPVRRRIFKHLIPNVIPLLIVNATMSLGGIIITEATLSFLGIGVKYPAASWGSIINQAQDSFVLQSYPWIWLPAGILILMTVLGFNFVGDGLRDAFDPKMKR